jgi:hypothetical protein
MHAFMWKKFLPRGVKILFVFWVLLYLYGTPLPQKTAILPEVMHGAPSQKATNDEKLIQKKLGDYSYTFTPQATYTIRGLVVSLHHSDSWIDISHDDDPAQTVDICVVWGPNITTNGYREVKYDHGDWTCYYSWTTEYDPAFSGNFLSNSHLIPHDKEEARLIKSIKVGDQIELSGLLTDYRISDSKGRLVGSRHTSLTRTDTGNGACEVIYLSSAKILKRNMPWRTPLMYTLAILVLLGLVASMYLEIPRYAKRPETLTGKPHAENPYDIRNFLNKKLLSQKNNNSAIEQLKGSTTDKGQDAPKKE